MLGDDSFSHKEYFLQIEIENLSKWNESLDGMHALRRQSGTSQLRTWEDLLIPYHFSFSDSSKNFVETLKMLGAIYFLSYFPSSFCCILFRFYWICSIRYVTNWPFYLNTKNKVSLHEMLRFQNNKKNNISQFCNFIYLLKKLSVVFEEHVIGGPS